MLIPYRYREALIEGYYNEDQTVTIHVTHPRVEAVGVYVAANWDEAKAWAEAAMDALIESWN